MPAKYQPVTHVRVCTEGGGGGVGDNSFDDCGKPFHAHFNSIEMQPANSSKQQRSDPPSVTSHVSFCLPLLPSLMQVLRRGPSQSRKTGAGGPDASPVSPAPTPPDRGRRGCVMLPHAHLPGAAAPLSASSATRRLARLGELATGEKNKEKKELNKE